MPLYPNRIRLSDEKKGNENILVALCANNYVHFGGLLARSDLYVIGAQLRWWNTKTVSVAEKENTLAFTSCVFTRLNPLAPSGGSPHALDEPESAATSIGSVMLSHDLLNSLAGLIGVVERDDANVVVEYVRLDNAVHKVAADESELTINGCGSTTGEVP